MASIYVTGDIHGDPSRLSADNFKAQKQMKDGQDNNFVIICGDFGLVWNQSFESKGEKYFLNWLERQPFTTLWIDGNHENFDRLYSSEYPIEMWNGGKVQKIRPHVIHLIRGEIYTILNNRFFAFGGAKSHDIRDGILDPSDTAKIEEWSKSYYKMFRVKHISWWEQETASQEEMARGIQNLKKYNNEVDYILTHCMPQEICSIFSDGFYQPDPMTKYFDQIKQNINFKKWFCGHYHYDGIVEDKFNVLYEQVVRIV